MSKILESVKSTIPAKAYDCKLSHAAACVHMTMIKSVRLGIEINRSCGIIECIRQGRFRVIVLKNAKRSDRV